MSKLRWLFATFVAVALIPSGIFAQEGGAIAGRVTDAETGQPLAGVTITVRGTQFRAVSNAEGQYRITDVPAGTYDVNATQIGRNPGSQTVTVAGETATADFSMATSAIALEGLVATATGEQQRAREVGNSVGVVNVDEEVELAAVNDVADVLAGRVAGVTVLQASGTTGTGARIRIRGSNSVSLSNDPLLIIDGVRIDNSSSSENATIGVGGQDTNRLSDLNPDNIESLEVLKGPAASALYGTAAANGVIVVTTKKGRAGDTRVNVYTEQGTLENVSEFPANFAGFLQDPAVAEDAEDCLIAVDGPCPFIQSFNPLENPVSSPFQDGYKQKYGVNVSGGTEAATYYLAADYEEEEGIYKFDVSSLERKNFRANIRGNLSDDVDITVNTGYTNSDLRLPQNDNNILGIVSGGLLSRCTSLEQSPRCEQALGFGFGVTPEDIANIDTRQAVERIIGSVTSNYRATSWLGFNAVLGLDRVNRFDNETVPPGRVFFGSLPEGERESNRAQVSNYTANLNASANYGVSTGITATTSVGTQYQEEIFRGTEAFGSSLLAGTSSLSGVNARFSVDEDNQQVRTLGGYVQQQVAFNDRIFLTGALRADDNSAFGEDFGLVYYPSASVSWVIAEEPFFPEQLNFLSTLRLRAAYGESGLRPGFRDAVTFLNPVAVTVGGESVPGFTFGDQGNPVLEPEKSKEYEFGFDTGLLDDRLGLEVTYYTKRSESALIERTLAPSLGLSNDRFENLGEVRNDGLEVLVNSRLLDRDKVRWNATVTAAWTENELTDIGIDASTGEPIPPIIFGLGGDSQRFQQGFPLGAFFQRPISFEDANNDGVIQVDEVEVGDTAQFLGNPFPTREASFNTDITLFDVVKLSGLLDYRGGFSNFNSTEEFRCGAFFICEALFNADVPLEQQAATVGTAFFGTAAGFIEEADFVKLREVSLTFSAPDSFAERFGGSGLSLTLAGRNLATWTDYSGLDPEINFAGSASNFTTAEFLTQPPVRFYTARVDVNF